MQERYNPFSTILKVQFIREIGRKDGLAKDQLFGAQELPYARARDEETRIEVKELKWNRMTHMKRKMTPVTWKRIREFEYDGKKAVAPDGRSQGQMKSKPSGRREAEGAMVEGTQDTCWHNAL